MRRLGRTILVLILTGILSTAILCDSAAGAVSGPVAAASAASARARKKVRALLRRNGLAKLPSVSGALAGRPSRHHGRLGAVVVGTPPALVEIPGQPITELFWQPGVIDAIVGGAPTQQQCGQFFSGGQDGDSGGLGACHMAESVGYSFANILQGDNSLCYMKRCPTAENLAAGGVSVVSGELPGGDITRLFSVPAGSTPRLVEVDVTGDPGGGGRDGGQTIFLRVHGDADNRAAGNLYNVEIWFCKHGLSAPADGFDRLTIANSGRFQGMSAESGDDQGTYVSTVDGYLTFSGGNVSYDTTRSRRAQVESVNQWGSFKGDVEIRTNNTIATKSYDAGDWGARKGYVVSSFSGTGPDSLRFLAGAFKEAQTFNGGFSGGMSGATEFRTSYYAAAPASDLLGQLDAVDLDTDDFFANPPFPSVDASEYACDATADVHVALDFNNATLRNSVAMCEDRRFNGMHFCYDDPTVNQAQQSYFSVCQSH
jgi:hypothetical protein